MDLHAGQIQGFFDIPTDNLFGAPVMSADIQARFADRNITVVSPDVGGVVRARALAKRLDNAPLAIDLLDKMLQFEIAAKQNTRAADVLNLYSSQGCAMQCHMVRYKYNMF